MQFFPISFFFYVLFLIIMCAIILTKCIILENDDSEFSLPLQKGSMIDTNGDSDKIIIALDVILIYSIMLLSIWESFFSWYRYYTTLDATTLFERPSIWNVFQKFSIYMIIFIASFLCEVHATYFIFPIVIILYTAFNTYCTLKFASLLIGRYRLFISLVFPICTHVQSMSVRVKLYTKQWEDHNTTKIY